MLNALSTIYPRLKQRRYHVYERSDENELYGTYMELIVSSQQPTSSRINGRFPIIRILRDSHALPRCHDDVLAAAAASSRKLCGTAGTRAPISDRRAGRTRCTQLPAA